jgi:hypothetical protein
VDVFTIKRLRDGRSDHVVEAIELRCCLCKQRFKALSLAYVAYIAPEEGGRADPTWVHKGCAERRQLHGENLRLWRGDFFLRAWLQDFLVPKVPTAALRDLPRRIGGRPWCDP